MQAIGLTPEKLVRVAKIAGEYKVEHQNTDKFEHWKTSNNVQMLVFFGCLIGLSHGYFLFLKFYCIANNSHESHIV